METAKKSPRTIDFNIILKEVVKNKKLFYKVLPVVFVLSILYILCIPRKYESYTSMAPESESMGAAGMLGSLASTFGIDLSSMESSDAITPLLYPDLMDDNGFVASILETNVETADGEVKTTYFDYLRNHQSYPWWTVVFESVKSLFASEDGSTQKAFDPYYLSKKDDDILGAVRNDIAIDVDKKTGVISISVSSQDKLVSKTLADSVRAKLQDYITLYRTNKARNDYNSYKAQAAQKWEEYEKASALYSKFADSNMGIVLQDYKSKLDDLENDMQLKYTSYSAMMTQMYMAQTKVQERTPVFTTLVGASVAIKPTSPKRMLFVIGMTILAAVALTIYSIRDYMFKD